MHSHYFFVYINNGDLMNIVLLCIEIFFARIIDVSLGTIRTVIVVKGKNLIGGLVIKDNNRFYFFNRNIYKTFEEAKDEWFDFDTLLK